MHLYRVYIIMLAGVSSIFLCSYNTKVSKN